MIIIMVITVRHTASISLSQKPLKKQLVLIFISIHLVETRRGIQRNFRNEIQTINKYGES
jgi:hypothetical protein